MHVLSLSLASLLTQITPPLVLAPTTIDIGNYSSVTPNDPSNDDAIGIRAALADAMNTSGEVIVLFPAGTYHLKSVESAGSASSHVLRIGSVYNSNSYLPESLHFKAEGAQFIMLDEGTQSVAAHGFLLVNDVPGFKASGFSLDYQDEFGRPTTSTMTEVIAQSANQTTTDVRVLSGYGPPKTGTYPQQYAHSRILDAATLGLVPGCANRIFSEIEQLNATAGEYRLHHQSMTPADDQLQVGNLLSLPRTQTGTQVAIRIERGTGCTLEDLTVHAAPFFAIHLVGTTDTSVQRVSVVPGWTPSGASVPRLFSSNRDAIHFQSPRGFVEVIDCVVAHSGDDAIAIHGSGFEVEQINGAVLTVDTQVNSGAARPYAGDTLRAFDLETTSFVDLTVTSVADADPPLNDAYWNITVDPPFPYGLDSWMQNNDAFGAGYFVSGNTCHQISGRGALINSGPGLITDNTISYTYGTGIAAQSSMFNTGIAAPISGVPDGVVIFGNDITHAALREGKWDFFRGAISMYHTTKNMTPQNWESANLLHNMYAVGNVMRNTHGPDMLISNATTVEVVDNDFIRSNVQNPGATDPKRGATLNSIIDLEWVDGITFEGNHIYTWGNPGGTIVSVDSNSSNLTPSNPALGFTVH